METSNMTAAQQVESRVLVIMTGGTICMKDSPQGLVPVTGFMKEAMAPRKSFNDGADYVDLPVIHNDGTHLTSPSLRLPPGKHPRPIRYTVHEFHPLLDSSSISSEGWTQIGESILANYHSYDGFVVLHGTDSMSYTCSALSFMIANLGKPIIFTGSQSPIFTLQSDAVSNLLGALIIAGSFSIPEVCLFFHHTLYRGNRTTKISASDFEAFASPNYEPLAKFNSISIDINWHLIERATDISPITLRPTLRTDAVACIRIFPGIKASMITSMITASGVRGLILETFGAGNSPEGDFLAGIESLVQKDIVIVNVSQCPSGSVSPLYAPAKKLGNVGVVFGHDMTTEAALTKLAYLFTTDMTTNEIIKAMTYSHRGELTVSTPTLFSHPPNHHPSLPAHVAAFTLLAHAIALNDIEEVRDAVGKEVLAAVPGLLRQTDTLGNSALHLAAVGADREVVSELLRLGASVHARNALGNTPLFLAVQAGKKGNVEVLRAAGGVLHAEERGE